MTKPEKRVPMRTCIVTRNKLPKNELFRLVRVKTETGYQVNVDLRNKLNGRGANITPDIEVLDKALVHGHIERALQLENKLTDLEKQALRDEFNQAIAEKEFRPLNKKVKIKISKEEFEAKMNS